jgi:hypothetical protein
MIKYSKLNMALAVAAFLTATSASAALSVSVGGNTLAGEGLVSSVAGAVTTNFNSGSLPANYTGGGVVSGSSSGLWASPPNDETSYLSVGPSTLASATVTLASLSSYFGYYGGSPDDYNHVDFYRGDATIGSFDGISLAELAGVPHDGNQSIGRFWNFTAQTSNDYFDRVVFSSVDNAFETDNHAVLAAVPEPETYAMMLAGLGLMGFVASRRRKNDQA